MKVQGFFSECREKEWQSKDGSKSGKSTFGMFVSGADTFKWESYHDAEWCKEKGIHTGAAGEAIIAFSINDYGYQQVKLLGFKTMEQKQPEPEQKPQEKNEVQKAAADRMMADAAADANDPDATTNLPF